MTTAAESEPQLVRALGRWDVALITVGSILGSAIFIAAADVPRAIPHPGLVLLLWVLGGLVTFAGALTYAEMSAMFPKAGGQYQFLKEAYGPLWGFLFGWTAFLVIMCGGIASLAVGFGDYLGTFFPVFSTRNVLFTTPVGPWTWSVSGGQVAAAIAITVLTAVNYVGVRAGTVVQNVVTVAKIGSLLALAVLGFAVMAPVNTAWAPSPVSAFSASGFGVAMIAILWSYDGWYQATFSAGETRDPGRNLPLGLLAGVAAIAVLYVSTNAIYFRALTVEQITAAPRVGEAAAQALFGPLGSRLLAAAIVVSIFGCLSAAILTCARVYQPMADDGLFFSSLARVHPVYHTPGASLVAQGVWSTVLAFTGTYEQLYTYVIFAAFLFHVATGIALFVLRRKRPDAPRPYRAWGYPLVPLLFVGTSMLFVLNTLLERPTESLWGLALVALGLPAYMRWRRAAHVRV